MKKKKVSPEKNIIKEVSALLIPALASLKIKLGEKKFDKRIKQAAKLLVRGIKPAAVKKKIPKKAANKAVSSSSLNTGKGKSVK